MKDIDLTDVRDIHNRMNYPLNVIKNIIKEYDAMDLVVRVTDNGIVSIELDDIRILDDGYRKKVTMPFIKKEDLTNEQETIYTYAD